MPAGARDRRRHRHAPAARRDRRARAFPRSRLPAQGGLRAAARSRRPSAASPPSSTCRTPSRPIGTRRGARRQAQDGVARRPMSITASTALLGEDTIEHVPGADRRRRDRLQALSWATLSARSPRPRPARCSRRSRSWRRPASASRSTPRPTRSWSGARRGCGRPAAPIPLAHLASRPAVVAIEAVSRAAILAEWTGARIHILHISSADELRPLREAKARGVDITGETCPHYLMLSADDYARFAGVIRVNPPVREARNQEPLWAALADGTIDMIATDHAPHAREEKTRNDILDGRLRLPRRRDADAADADRGERRPHDDHATMSRCRPRSPPRPSASIRARA